MYYKKATREGKIMSTKEYSKAILASYVTYKELYSRGEYKSSYQILAEFIKYIIKTDKLYTFSVVELQKRVDEVFEFSLPNAVIKSALKKIEYVEKCEGEKYIVKADEVMINQSLEMCKEEADIMNENVSELLFAYATETLQRSLDEKEKKEIFKEFVAYLIDETNGNKYQELISAFIIKNSNNDELTAYLQSIRVGGILYAGLNYNIDEVGSITNKLVLYLDMEILFDIYGYNGQVFQQLALDLINLVKVANKKEKKISLKFFEETKYEIDMFFAKAEDIVNGKVVIKDNVAMKSIVNGCNDSTDVSDRKSDFYSTLQYRYGIVGEDNKSYYDLESHVANLEGWFKEEEKKDADFQFSIKMVSHINKLRKNQIYYDYTKAGYIFITETWKTIECSKKVVDCIKEQKNEERNLAGYAVSMNMMTNLLWFKLNQGFGGKDYPENANSLMKAKIVLSNWISQNITKTFQTCKDEYEKGNLTDRQLAARLLALREKAVRPEDICINNLDDSLNFNPQYISRFEQECDMQRMQIAEKDDEIQDYKSEIEELQTQLEEEKDRNKKFLDGRDAVIAAKDKELAIKEAELESYRQQDIKKERHRKQAKRIIRLIYQVFFRFLGLILLAIIINFVFANLFKIDITNMVSLAINIIGIVVFMFGISKKQYDKIFSNVKSEE